MRKWGVMRSVCLNKCYLYIYVQGSCIVQDPYLSLWWLTECYHDENSGAYLSDLRPCATGLKGLYINTRLEKLRRVETFSFVQLCSTLFNKVFISMTLPTMSRLFGSFKFKTLGPERVPTGPGGVTAGVETKDAPL